MKHSARRSRLRRPRDRLHGLMREVMKALDDAAGQDTVHRRTVTHPYHDQIGRLVEGGLRGRSGRSPAHHVVHLNRCLDPLRGQSARWRTAAWISPSTG
jgi:hypothetical protein